MRRWVLGLILLVGCGDPATQQRPQELEPLGPVATIPVSAYTDIVVTTAADIIATAPPGAPDPYAYDPNVTFTIVPETIAPPPTPPPAQPVPQQPQQPPVARQGGGGGDQEPATTECERKRRRKKCRDGD